MKKSQPVPRYYRTFESRLGYRWLKGVKHFGYYPDGSPTVPMLEAQLQMNEQLAKTLALSAGAQVLDAGCGEGGVALYLASKHDLNVTGIDILDFNIAHAKHNAKKQGVGQRVTFQVGDYTKLPFKDETFDAIYTMETLVHAPDYEQALREFLRVLKPGGRLVHFEYSLLPQEQVTTKEDRQAFKEIRKVNELAYMPSFNKFEHGVLVAKLRTLGMQNVAERDITKNMLPMVDIFYKRAKVPYTVVKSLGLQDHFVNAMSAVVLHEHTKLFRYNIVMADKLK
jgi:sterol 24-C-methyltransferase